MNEITRKEIIEKVAKKYNLTSELPDFSDPKVVKRINARVINEAFKDIACCCGAKFRKKR